MMVKHYFSKFQDSESKPKFINFRLFDKDFRFYTDSGIFSRKKLDKGSELLIKSLELKDYETVLDLGCGWGCIGICLKILHPELDVTLSDINLRALKISRMNRELNNVKVHIRSSDGFKKLKDFDLVLFNPPQTAGKIVWQRLIKESQTHCKSLQVVARHNKGGKSIEAFMLSVFGNVKTINKKGGFRVYASFNPSS